MHSEYQVFQAAFQHHQQQNLANHIMGMSQGHHGNALGG